MVRVLAPIPKRYLDMRLHCSFRTTSNRTVNLILTNPPHRETVPNPTTQTMKRVSLWIPIPAVPMEATMDLLVPIWLMNSPTNETKEILFRVAMVWRGRRDKGGPMQIRIIRCLVFWLRSGCSDQLRRWIIHSILSVEASTQALPDRVPNISYAYTL